MEMLRCAILRSDQFSDFDTQRVLADLFLHQNEDHDICQRPILGNRDQDQNEKFFSQEQDDVVCPRGASRPRQFEY